MAEHDNEHQERVNASVRRFEQASSEYSRLVASDAEPNSKAEQLQKLVQEMSDATTELARLSPALSTGSAAADPAGSTLSQCTERARNAARAALAIARDRHHLDIEPRDLLDALSTDRGLASAALECIGHSALGFPRNRASVDDESPEASAAVQRIVKEAADEAKALGHHYVGTEHLLLALMRIHPDLVPDAGRVRTEVLTILGHST